MKELIIALFIAALFGPGSITPSYPKRPKVKTGFYEPSGTTPLASPKLISK